MHATVTEWSGDDIKNYIQKVANATAKMINELFIFSKKLSQEKLCYKKLWD